MRRIELTQQVRDIVELYKFRQTLPPEYHIFFDWWVSYSIDNTKERKPPDKHQESLEDII